MTGQGIVACYTNPFINALNILGGEDTYLQPELMLRGRLNFKVEVDDKPSKLFYVTYNIQTGFFDVHVSKVGGLNTEKAQQAIKQLELLTDCIEVLNDELELIREIIDIKNGR